MNNKNHYSLFTRVAVPKRTRLAIVGDSHGHAKAFSEAATEAAQGNYWLVSLGDAYDKGHGEIEENQITSILMEAQEKGYGFAIKGNHELKKIRQNKNNLSKELLWWQKQPICISFDFWNGTKITVVHGGITPHLKSLNDIDLDVCYIREIDENGKHIPLVWKTENERKQLVKVKEGGTIWHKLYDGRFGYIVSGHDSQSDGLPKFYNYSCNIDSQVFTTGLLTCFFTDEDGNRDKFVQYKCKPSNPEEY
jgi:predicted phosphodiesterase